VQLHFGGLAMYLKLERCDSSKKYTKLQGDNLLTFMVDMRCLWYFKSG